MNIHEWAAEQCGFCVMTGADDREYFYRPNTAEPPYDFEWTLADARCREIVREHFKIETELSRGFYVGWVCYSREEPYFLPNAYSGKAIAEAEINCIEAIREEQK